MSTGLPFVRAIQCFKYYWRHPVFKCLIVCSVLFGTAKAQQVGQVNNEVATIYKNGKAYSSVSYQTTFGGYASCQSGSSSSSIPYYLLSNAVYNDPSGTKTPLNGMGQFIMNPISCTSYVPYFGDFELTAPGITVKLNPATNVATFTETPVIVNLYPKFLVLSVLYAPPGKQSSVDYSNSTLQGNSTSLSNSNGDEFSTSLTQGASFGVSVSVLGTAGKLTSGNKTTVSTSFEEAVDNSSSISTSKKSTTSLSIPGPTSSTVGIDHDQDVILVWLNPVINATVNLGKVLTWSGYQFDSNDPMNLVDYVELRVSWLKNAGLACDSTADAIPCNVRSRLNRTWDATGLGALTNDDLQTILARDPFAASPNDPNFISNPNTDTSGRFTLQQDVSFNYEPKNPLPQSHTIEDEKTTTDGNGHTDTYKVGFSYEHNSSLSLGLVSLTNDLKISNSATHVHKSSSQKTNSTTDATTIKIVPPEVDSNYSGKTGIQLWLDNVYGTYMFYAAQ